VKSGAFAPTGSGSEKSQENMVTPLVEFSLLPVRLHETGRHRNP
jgi:hypothetical protein